ncbi:MAG: tetratricopeptide repeat protein [Candidatus Hodarchaeales archaeon]|jgi:tetratricopeptide (TPR) repeat protein
MMMDLKRINDLIQQKKDNQALEEIEQLRDKDRIVGLIYKSTILTRKREFDTALTLLDEILDKDKFKTSLTQEFGARIAKIQALIGLKDFSQIFEEIDLSEQILKQMDEINRNRVKEWEGKLLSYKGGFKVMEGDLEKAVDSFLRSLALYEDIDNKQEIYSQLNNIGWIYRAQGELDQALTFFQRQLKISEEIGDKKYISWSFFSIGYIYFYKGDLDQATNYAQKSLIIFTDLEYQSGLHSVYSLIGSIHRGKGDFDKGLEYYQKVLVDYGDIEKDVQVVTHTYCVTQRYLGYTYYYMSRLKESIDCYKKSIKAHKTTCHLRNTLYDYELAVVYLLMILTSIELEDNELIDYCLEELAEFTNKWSWLSIINKTAQALVLKNKKRARYKIQAQEIFEEILVERFDYEIEFIVQVNLCELLLDELKLYEVEDIIEEIRELLDKISNIANKQRSITTLVLLYSLQSRLTLIEGNAELSNGLLTRALEIAENKGIKLLSNRLIRQQQLIFSQVGEWKALLERNSSLQKKIEQVNLQGYIDRAIKVRCKLHENL